MVTERKTNTQPSNHIWLQGPVPIYGYTACNQIWLQGLHGHIYRYTACNHIRLQGSEDIIRKQ